MKKIGSIAVIVIAGVALLWMAGMSLLNAPSFRQTIVKGLVLLLAVWFDMSRNKGERA